MLWPLRGHGRSLPIDNDYLGVPSR